MRTNEVFPLWALYPSCSAPPLDSGHYLSLGLWDRCGECKLNAYQEEQKEYRLKEVVGDYFRLRESRRIFCLMLLYLGVCIPAAILLGRYLLG